MRRYRCVDAQKVAGFPVVAACTAAGVSTSAYHAWTASAQGAAERHRKEVRLVAEICRIHARSGGTYGAGRFGRGPAVACGDREGGCCWRVPPWWVADPGPGAR